MSRSVPWRRTVSDAVSWRQDQAQNATIYILREMGPTGFLLKEEGEVKKFKVFLGDPNKCTCPVFSKERDLCKHICWVLLKKFRIPRQNPLTFQIGLVEREINEILRGQTQHEEVKRHITRKPVSGPKDPYAVGKDQLEQRPITEDDVCPICQDELLGKHEPVTYCRFGCAKSVHIKCMKVWAEHQRSTGEEVIKCPLCREHFGPIDAIQTEYRNSSIRKTRAERLDLHLGSTCKKCGVAPIAGKCYKCSVCAEYYLCHACFLTPTHKDHSFQFRQKPSQRWRPAPRCSDTVLPNAVIGDMEGRELTDNDYETLLQLDSEASQAPSSVPESFIKSLPSEKVRQGSSLLVPGSQCRVCLRAYAVGEKVRRLPCQHKFHALCIDPWLLHQRATCPIDGATVYNPLMEALARDERRKKNIKQKKIDSKNSQTALGWGRRDEQVDGLEGLVSTFALTGSGIVSSNRTLPVSNGMTQRNIRTKKTSPARWRSNDQRGDTLSSAISSSPLGISTLQVSHHDSNLKRLNRDPQHDAGAIDMVQLVNGHAEEDDTDYGNGALHRNSRNLPVHGSNSTTDRELFHTTVETFQFDTTISHNCQRVSNWQQRPPRPPGSRNTVKPQAPSIPLLRQAAMTPVGNRLSSGAMSAPHHRQVHSDDNSPSNSDTERGRGRMKGRLMQRRTRSSSLGRRRGSIEHLHPAAVDKQEMFENMFLGSATGRTLVGRRDSRTRPTKPTGHRLRDGEPAGVNSAITGFIDMDIALTGQGVGSLQLQDKD
ncbi:uncharacterized protein [Antedon mediterranea]|uniref:uncharacterized protein n=1 Tax=Antedon mediterranea TaxID=105859 RepID=UPI003AF4BA80